MQFITKKKRPPVIALVSLIDVLVLLLIFFMVSTTFKQSQPEVQLKMPESKHAVEGEAIKNAPLILTIDKTERLYLGDQLVPLPDLVVFLKREQKERPDLVLELKSDEKVSFGTIIKVMDAAKDANIQNVKALTKPVEETQPLATP
ncbi:MAG: biopolymer transporter ExbD [Verrucomicrobiota bacterium]|nr:biopolymer transporter ExbD [Verrucomicrobiota bacterium]